MRTEIKELHQRLKTTTVYVTHDQIEAMTMADKIVVMHDGIVEQIGSPLELYDRPANQFVAGFIGSPAMNFLSARIASLSGSRARVSLAIGPTLDIEVAQPVRQGAAVTVGIRPEHLKLAGPGEPGSYTGEAFMVEMLGSDTFIHLHEGEEPLVIRDSGARRARIGDPVTVSLPAAACYLFDDTGAQIALRNRPAARETGAG
jgi:multiple sugar transport system ATP-binding protein